LYILVDFSKEKQSVFFWWVLLFFFKWAFLKKNGGRGFRSFFFRTTLILDQYRFWLSAPVQLCWLNIQQTTITIPF